MTIRDFFREWVSAHQRRCDEHDARAWLAWHIAALTHGSKGMPPLKSLLARRQVKQTLASQRSTLKLLSEWYRLPLREVRPRA